MTNLAASPGPRFGRRTASSSRVVESREREIRPGDSSAKSRPLSKTEFQVRMTHNLVVNYGLYRTGTSVAGFLSFFCGSASFPGKRSTPCGA